MEYYIAMVLLFVAIISVYLLRRRAERKEYARRRAEYIAEISKGVNSIPIRVHKGD